MRPLACFYSILILSFCTSLDAEPKSLRILNLRENRQNNQELYPVKRKASNLKQASFVGVHEEQPEMEYIAPFEPAASARFRRLNDQLPLDGDEIKSDSSQIKQYNPKRSTNGLRQRDAKLYKRELKHSCDNYGIVYGNGKPIGILEPFPQSYDFSPLRREFLEKEPSRRAALDAIYPRTRLNLNWKMRDAEYRDPELQEPAKYTNDNYPSILTDFKIEDRLSNSASIHETKEADSEQKITSGPNEKVPKHSKVPNEKQISTFNNEDIPETGDKKLGISNSNIAELKSTLNRIQNPGPLDNVAEIEDDLKDILDDMGLIEGKAKVKRGAEEQQPIRGELDREDENLETGTNKVELVRATQNVPNYARNKREEKTETKDDNKKQAAGDDKTDLSNEENDSLDKLQDAKPTKISNYQSEGDAFIRSKRQENNELLKGLEKSGDLTISGNKSPLASSENDAEIKENCSKDQSLTTPPTVADKAKRERNELEYQQKVEQNIQSKINAIKEQVKREIAALKANTETNQRNKRDTINTLLEEESNALDPQEHPEEKLRPHVRLRRNLEGSSAHTRVKRGVPGFSNLQNIDTGDYTDLIEENPEERSERQSSTECEADQKANNASESSIGNSKPRLEKRSVTSEPEDKRDVTNKYPATSKIEISLSKNIDDDIKKETGVEEIVTEIAQELETKQINGLGETKLAEELDDESDVAESQRKRRQIEEELQDQPEMIYGRRKRSNAVMPFAKSSFFPYRGGDGEIDDDGDEFEDDNFDDRARLQKRDVAYSPEYNNQVKRSFDYHNDQDYQDFSNDYPANNYQFHSPQQKRSLANTYVAGLNSDVFETPNNYLYEPNNYVREKRQDFNDLAALHGGGPMLHHLAAVRERNTQQNDDAARSKRTFKHGSSGIAKNEPENIADLSDSDLFGALPASYDGNNLQRFKRVKRENTFKK